MLRTQVERVPSIPYEGGVLHDEESGDNPVVWVDEQRITAREAWQLEENLNQAAVAKGRRLTPCEVLAMVPFVA